ncbi:MAG TPA: dipeptidase [Ktedonosporobacter sp.]|jgi:membrane dipeptidase|nr:dipeptidase [Ktedonosporobacter sp.]
MTDISMPPVFDGHNDTLLHLYFPERGNGRSFFIESEKGHLDLPRARKGGFGGGFFAIFPPAPTQERTMKDSIEITSTGYRVREFPALDPAYAQRITIAVAASLFRLEVESQGQFKVVRTADELAHCLQEGILAAILHFEGAEAIDTGLDALEVFYQAGLRSLGIVWSRPNAFGYGVPFRFPHAPDTGPGLTEAGKELVRACNRLGIMLDLSHLNEQGFWDVARLSDAPLVATHTCVHAICPSTRNLTDKQLDAIKESEGMVGLNFEVSNLREDGHKDANTPLDVMVRHIDYLVERVGIDGVGFGSDFDGGITPCQEIHDVTGLPKLLAALQAHGYDDVALRKLAHENWLRVLRQTWKS